MGLKEVARWLSGWFGPTPQVGYEELKRRVVAAVEACGRGFGRAGEPLFPPAVLVTIQTPADTQALVEGLLAHDQFDPEVDALLVNRIPKLPRSHVPARRYQVVAGERVEVGAAPLPDEEVQLTIGVLDGDCAGNSAVLPVRGDRTLALGRGEQHDDGRVNHLVVTRTLAFVSRGALVVRRAGPHAEVRASDAGARRHTWVVASDGRRMCLDACAGPWVLIRAGDVIEIGGGDGAPVRIELRGPAPLVRNEGS